MTSWPKNRVSGRRASPRSALFHTSQAAMPMARKISDQATGKTMLGGVQSGLRRPAYQVSRAGLAIAAPRRPAARRLITQTSSLIGLVRGAMDTAQGHEGGGLGKFPPRAPLLTPP